MATTIRITLLSGTVGQRIAVPISEQQNSLQLDYPPSPYPLLASLLRDHPELRPLLSRLQRTAPEYHLPYGQPLPERRAHSRSSRGRAQRYGGSSHGSDLVAAGAADAAGMPDGDPLWLGEGAMLHLCWPVDLSAEDERLLNAALASLSSLGRPQDRALWQVVPSMPEPNCRPAADGSLLLLCAEEAAAGVAQPALNAPPGWLRYHFAPPRDAPLSHGASATQANRALYAVEGDLALPASAGIAWTDRLHRALLQRAPGSSLFAGLSAGRPLPEDQRAWYRWDSSNGSLIRLEVLSPMPFAFHELDALSGLRWLFAGAGLRVPLRLLKLDAMQPCTAVCVRTSTPMLLYSTPRPGKLQRSPAAQAIQSLLWGVGEEGKLAPDSFAPDGPEGGVQLLHRRFGRIRARAWLSPEATLLTSRSGRRAATCRGYHAVLAAEQPLPLLGVGWGRHFGAGRLEAWDPQPIDREHPALVGPG